MILVDGFSTLNEKARVWQCDELFNYLKSKNFNFKVGTQKTDIFKTYSSREIKVSQNLLDFDDGPKTDCEIFEMVIIDELNKEEKHFIENIFSFVRMNNKNLKLNTASFIRFLKGLPLEPPAESLNKKSILERQRDDFKLSISDNIIALIPSKKTRTVLFFWSLLFFGFLYLIRPIFYLLKWSYKTLNE